MLKLKMKICWSLVICFLILGMIPSKDAHAFKWVDGKIVLEKGEVKLTLKPGESVFIPTIYHFMVDGDGNHTTIWKSLKTGEEIVEQGWSEYADWDGEVSNGASVTIKNTSSKPIIIQGNLGKYQLIPIKGSFSDVKRDHYAFEAIEWAKNKKIIEGYTNGKFGPNDSVTEAQFAKMIVSYFGLANTTKQLPKYTTNALWSDDFYNRLAMYSVPMNGYFDNSIRNKAVKRGVVAQALAYLSEGKEMYSLNNSVMFLLETGISTGQGAIDMNNVVNSFGYHNNLTRAQAVTFLYRMENKKYNQLNKHVKNDYSQSASLSIAAAANTGKDRVDAKLRLGKNGVEKTQNLQGVTVEQAEKILREALSLPSTLSVVHDRTEGSDYIFQVYEYKGTHNVTWGWYGVNKQTGNWYDWMASFD